MLKAKYPSVDVSESTIKRTRKELGWVAKRTRYCALISEKNRDARVTWCNEQIAEGDLYFENVVWSDECTVQLESYHHITFRKKGQLVVYRMGPKHPPPKCMYGQGFLDEERHK